MFWSSSFGSTVAGYISILFWLIVFIPQLQENYKRKNGDGLSLTFLIIWLAGDLFNLAGIIMERLMFTMFLLALWYTIADICLIWQVIYYQQCVTLEIKCDEDEAIVLLDSNKNSLKQRGVGLEKSSKADTTADTLERQSSSDALLDKDQDYDTDMVNDDSTANDDDGTDRDIFTIPPKIKPIWVNLIGSSALVMLIVASCYGYLMTATETVNDEKIIQLMPQVLGWLSAVLYVGSRVPQLIKNWSQQSTDGLSSGMFVCAVFGNFFFSLSIFLKSTEKRYIIVNLPWIIGSLGTVIFDIMIFLQFYVFGRRKLKHRAD